MPKPLFRLPLMASLLLATLFFTLAASQPVFAQLDNQHCVGSLSAIDPKSEAASEISTVRCYATFQEAIDSVMEAEAESEPLYDIPHETAQNLNPSPSEISDAKILALITALSSAQESDEAWRGLTQEEQTAIVERGLTPTEIRPLESALPPELEGSCWLADKTFGAYSPVGLLLFSFGQRIKWCANGSQVTTTYERMPLYGIHAPFWHYRGIDQSSLTPTPAATVTSYYKGKFEICYPMPVGCVERRYPWIRFILKVNGTYTYSNG